MDSLFYLVPAASVVALLFAWIFYHKMRKEDEGTPTMKQIAQFVREGAMAYLKQQYKIVVIVFIILAIFFAILRENYDGYHFSEDNVPGLYNPFKNDKLEIICIGVNYSGKGRNIDKWLVNYL